MSAQVNIIGLLYRKLVKPVVFLANPEHVHDAFTQIGSFLGKNFLNRKFTRILLHYKNEKLEQEIAGIKFLNPVGLSAGFDKDAHLQNILPEVGFGFMQVGSVTLHPYGGNTKPRLTRLKKSKGIVVNYGLKNIGVDKIIPRIKNHNNPDFPLSISIAKTNCKDTASTEEAILDYYGCIKKLEKSDVGDFYTINISCPNTFGGEPFTTAAKLEKLLAKIMTLNIEKPIFVKMPINMEWHEFKELLEIIIEHKITGVIIGNLNKDRKLDTIKDHIPKDLKGGISGTPTKELCNKLISKTYKHYGKKLIIVGVGGIFSTEDAYEKIKLGSSLVQLITGMIFQGPQLIGEINRGLVKLLEKDGFKNIHEAIGSFSEE